MAGGMIHMLQNGTHYGVVIKEKGKFTVEIWTQGGDRLKNIKGLPSPGIAKRVVDDKLKEAEECDKAKQKLPDKSS